jgi:hypothetical protein
MKNKDKEEFEKWYALSVDQTLKDSILYRQFLDDTLPDHTKTFCEKAWKAACEYMQAELAHHIFKIEAENKKLRDALNILRQNLKWDHGNSQIIREALEEAGEE